MSSCSACGETIQLFLNFFWVSNCLKLLGRSLEMTKFIRHPNPSEAIKSSCSEVELLPKPECPICIEPLEFTTRVMPCGHTLHFDCIHSWILAQIGIIKDCPCCRTKITALQQINKHGCYTSARPVSRIYRESLITRLQPIGGEGDLCSSDGILQQRRTQWEPEVEIIEEAMQPGEAAQLEAYERFRQDRREAHQRAGEQRPQWMLLIPPPFAHQCFRVWYCKHEN